MSLPFTKDQIKQANEVSLIELVKAHGYSLESGGRRALHARQSGGLYLFRDNNKFYHFSTDTRGGPIDYLMQFERMSFKEAVTHLLKTDLQKHVSTPLFSKPGTFILPTRAPNYSQILLLTRNSSWAALQTGSSQLRKKCPFSYRWLQSNRLRLRISH